jgi:hypothetical protein
MLGPSNLCFANPRTGVILFAPYLFIVSSECRGCCVSRLG